MATHLGLSACLSGLASRVLCEESVGEVEWFSQPASSVLLWVCVTDVLLAVEARFGLFLSSIFSGTSFLTCPLSTGFSATSLLLLTSGKLADTLSFFTKGCALLGWFASSRRLFELRSPSLNCLPSSIVHVVLFNLPFILTQLIPVAQLGLDVERDSTCLRVFALLPSVVPEIVWWTDELVLLWFSLVALSSSFLALVYVTVPLVTVAVYFTVLDGEGFAALVFLAPTELELDDDNRVIPFTLEILKSVKRKNK